MPAVSKFDSGRRKGRSFRRRLKTKWKGFRQTHENFGRKIGGHAIK